MESDTKPKNYIEVHLNSEDDSVAEDTGMPVRETWKSNLDFLIACVSSSIGLGNVWRFPYLCYKNGGGAFLIPYFISVIFAGIPIFLLEVTIGQMTSSGVIRAWNICPLFQGIGFTNLSVNFLLYTYYAVILAWAARFLFASFTTTLPWSHCNHTWSSSRCQSNLTSNLLTGANQPIDPATNYWEYRVLSISDGIEEVGTIQWELALCLIFVWLLMFLFVFKGIKFSRKILYITAIAPYVFMVILIIRMSLLKGSLKGVIYYLRPETSKLMNFKVWSDAGTQIFFSYSVCQVGLTAFGSYNKYRHNALRVTNSITSLLAGFVIFATLGYMSESSGLRMEEVAESGPGLGFVIYPMALSTMPASPIWSICFFAMLIVMGIGSMFGGVEGFVVALADLVPVIHGSAKRRAGLVAFVCIASFFVGLSMITNGGMYVFQLFDYYSGSRIVVLIGFLEVVVAGYLYGAGRMSRHMKEMYGVNLRWIPILFWCILTPIFTFALFTISVFAYEVLTYKRRTLLKPYEFPGWAVLIGWLLAASSMLLIPIVMGVRFISTEGSLLQRLRYLVQPKLPDGIMERLKLNEQSSYLDNLLNYHDASNSNMNNMNHIDVLSSEDKILPSCEKLDTITVTR